VTVTDRRTYNVTELITTVKIFTALAATICRFAVGSRFHRRPAPDVVKFFTSVIYKSS